MQDTSKFHLIYDPANYDNLPFKLVKETDPLVSYEWFTFDTILLEPAHTFGPGYTLKDFFKGNCWQSIHTFDSLPTHEDIRHFLSTNPEYLI